MASIATQILNHYDGVKPIVDEPVSARKPKRQPAPAPVMTEGMLRNKEMLRSNLRSGVWSIEFTKVDGTPAVMECTLDPAHLPAIDPDKINVAPRTEKEEPAHLLHVYAVDRQGWRSFVVPNVTKISKVLS